MSAGDVPKLGGAVQGTAPGSAHEGGTLVLLQADDGGPSVLAAEALVPGMLPQWHIRLARGPLTGATATLAHVSRPAEGLSESMPPRGRLVRFLEFRQAPSVHFYLQRKFINACTM